MPLSTTKLPAILSDEKTLSALNKGVLGGQIVLDWSEVEQASDSALLLLLESVELDRHGDSLGIDSMSDSLVDRIDSLLSKRRAPKKKKERISVKPEANAPSVFKGADTSTTSTTASLPFTYGTTPLEVRDHLLKALYADLIGPYDGGSGELPAEEISLPPSRWYLTGFLAPEEGREIDDPTEHEELGVGNLEDEEESPPVESEPKQVRRYPASCGLSVLLPPGDASEVITVTVGYADYVLDQEKKDSEEEGKKKRDTYWRRVAIPEVNLEIKLDRSSLTSGIRVPDGRGLWLVGVLEETHAPGLDKGTRALSLFLVNRRAPGEKGRQDEQFIFQVSLRIRYEKGLVARPNLRHENSSEWDDRVADLQFRNRYEYAVGHGCSTKLGPLEGGKYKEASTCWLPTTSVPRVTTRELSSVTTSMEALAALPDAAAAQHALLPLVQAYKHWLKEQSALDVGSAARKETAKLLLQRADFTRLRMLEGIDRLTRDSQLFDAFRLANAAMAKAARQRSPERFVSGKVPQWRLFQLAFLLMTIAGIDDEAHEDRDTVELIFFPTGGGKTEAYLGVIALSLILRRLRGASRPDAGLGVAVLLRYTLRLLTLDQLSRAATLICALEEIRKSRSDLGLVRFSVGLWVGRTATANTLTEVSEKITLYKNNESDSGSPFPLTECPWCQRRIGKDGMLLLPNKSAPKEVVVGCTNFSCNFSLAKTPKGLPVLFVDEQIYRELPSFLLATVDKFAMLPWRAETAGLFGKVTARRGGEFTPMGAEFPKERDTIALPQGLRPPDLIVQDELHLISGPLGTMVGLYETAVESLSTRVREDGVTIVPKLIASTATVRRAREQVQALFGRKDLAIFPPPGVNESDTFFAEIDNQSPGRLYVGVGARGRASKAVSLRTFVALLGAAQRQIQPGTEHPADPYMTVVGYFNSLRELGGTRRLLEDEVRTRCVKSEERRPRNAIGSHRWLARREIELSPVELTSRESTGNIAHSKSGLSRKFGSEGFVDVALATNMISVGVDIERLGLMLVNGQPKTTSEYIQATSRVGRDPARPGLVITVLNLFRPRDRSHYERFSSYHESYYRHVEATSLTPFSGPALDRGLSAVLVALCRLAEAELTPPTGVIEIGNHRDVSKRAIETIAERGARERDGTEEDYRAKVAALTRRGQNIVDAWLSVIQASRDAAALGELRYSRYDKGSRGKPLLYTILDEDLPPVGSDEAKFSAPTSMRDVEPSVHLWKVTENMPQRSGNNGR